MLLLAMHGWTAAAGAGRPCLSAQRMPRLAVSSSASGYLGQRLRAVQLVPGAGWRSLHRAAVQQRPRGRTVQRVQASFFGVGAPEALLVGVVALIVFGPKGLAEAVKSLGKTLKTFQPTIRELASVSSDLKITLEEQIGLDDIRAEFRNSTVPVRRTSAVSQQASSMLQSDSDAEAALEPQLRSVPADPPQQTEVDPEIERKRQASAAAAWGAGDAGTASAPPVRAAEGGAEGGAAAGGAGPSGAAAAGPDLSSLRMEELEMELARRRAQVKH